MDIRTVLPREVLQGPYVTQIRFAQSYSNSTAPIVLIPPHGSFNPIAPTLLTRALTGLVTAHFSPSCTLSKSKAKGAAALGHRKPSKEELELIVEASGGDIRSAVMSLQFACVHMGAPSDGQGKRKRRGNTRAL